VVDEEDPHQAAPEESGQGADSGARDRETEQGRDRQAEVSVRRDQKCGNQ
jgi:hypothetical protein